MIEISKLIVSIVILLFVIFMSAKSYYDHKKFIKLKKEVTELEREYDKLRLQAFKKMIESNDLIEIPMDLDTFEEFEEWLFGYDLDERGL